VRIEVAPSSRVERGMDEGLMVVLSFGGETIVDNVIPLELGQNPPKATTEMVELAVVPVCIMIEAGLAETAKLPAVTVTVVEWLRAPLVPVKVRW